MEPYPSTFFRLKDFKRFVIGQPVSDIVHLVGLHPRPGQQVYCPTELFYALDVAEKIHKAFRNVSSLGGP